MLSTISIAAMPQFSDFSFFGKAKYGKVIISKYIIKDKRFISLDDKDFVESVRKVGERELTDIEINEIFKHIDKNVSTGSALTNLQNVVIEFYISDVVTQKISFAYHGGNITLRKYDCDKEISVESQEEDSCWFRGHANSEFFEFVNKLKIKVKRKDISLERKKNT